MSVMKIEISRLNLLSPVYGDGEKLFYFELDEAGEFEPDKTRFLDNPVSCGELPPGDYLFAQKRETLNHKEIIDLAIEIHQEGLWQRLILGKRLYLRYLFEDGREVTQLFRPYSRTASTI